MDNLIINVVEAQECPFYELNEQTCETDCCHPDGPYLCVGGLDIRENKDCPLNDKSVLVQVQP